MVRLLRQLIAGDITLVREGDGDHLQGCEVLVRPFSGWPFGIPADERTEFADFRVEIVVEPGYPPIVIDKKRRFRLGTPDFGVGNIGGAFHIRALGGDR